MFYERLNEQQRGLVGMVFGFILLLYTLDIFAAMLYYILLVISLGLIGCGFVQAGLYAKVMALINKSKQQPPR